MKVVRAAKYEVLGYNSESTELVPEGWVIKTRDESKPETTIVDRMKYVDGYLSLLYEEDGQIYHK